MRINFVYKNDNVKKKTAIGRSNFSRPLNKHKRRQWKKYRGQGKWWQKKKYSERM